MMYGTIYGTGLSMLAIGYPDYDPRRVVLPPDSTQWSHATWNFFPTPSLLTVGPGLWNGVSSSCMTCSVGKMYTISPANNPSDKSCFGLCNGAPTGRWDQVVMGDLIQPCNQVRFVSEQCTIQYAADGSWYQGVDGGGGGAATTWYVNFTTDSPTYGLEGIVLGLPLGVQGSRAPAGTFTTLLPYPSTPQTACELAATNAGFGQVPIDSLADQPQQEYVASQGYTLGSWVLAEAVTNSPTDSGLPLIYGPPICYV